MTKRNSYPTRIEELQVEMPELVVALFLNNSRMQRMDWKCGRGGLRLLDPLPKHTLQSGRRKTTTVLK